MYSGTTFRTKSGRVMGVHQKIDRVALKHLTDKLPKRTYFPGITEILHFEGLNGPDGIKRKSPGKDEPWHYIDPFDQNDREIVTMINDHIFNLAKALKEKNRERAAFEAAWMAHAITDGLTPAHHYPLEAKLEELRDGQGLETRTTTKEKLVLPGRTRRHQLRNNWEFWGAKGIMTTHLAFELGVATGIAPLRFEDAHPTAAEYKRIAEEPFSSIYEEILQEVAAMDMYEEFGKLGWTRHLATEARETLLPRIIKAVILGWYKACLIAKEN
jgi:hypothetical protein